MQANNHTAEQTGRTFIEKARRQQIVEAAIETIAELGLTKTSYGKIAERAELSSTGLISYHFKNKAELLEQVMLEIERQAGRVVGNRVKAEATAAGALRARIEAVLEWVSSYPQHVKALYEISVNARHDDGSLRYGPNATMDANITELIPILKRGQQNGEFREFDTLLMAMAIKATVDVAIYRMSAKPSLSVEACAREVSTLFELAIRKAR